MAGRILLRRGEREYRVEVSPATVIVDGVTTQVAEKAIAVGNGDTRWVFIDGEVYEFDVQSPGRRRGGAHHGTLTAPMPATVRRIVVEPGAVVRKGDTLLVLEAMKMELPVRAPSDGTVTVIACREGELVQPGLPLVEME